MADAAQQLQKDIDQKWFDVCQKLRAGLFDKYWTVNERQSLIVDFILQRSIFSFWRLGEAGLKEKHDVWKWVHFGSTQMPIMISSTAP